MRRAMPGLLRSLESGAGLLVVAEPLVHETEIATTRAGDRAGCATRCSRQRARLARGCPVFR